MNNIFSKCTKIVIYFSIGITILLIVFLICGIIHDCCQPKHIVYIEYTIFRDGVEYHKNGTYEVCGKEFEVVNRIEKTSNRYGSGYGPNVLLILDKTHWFAYFGKQSVCVYSGYNDVECTYFEVVE